MNFSARSRTLNELLSCAAPLIFCDADGENPFFGGTCFRTIFADRLYIVTARHCITNSGINPHVTRLECAAPERAYLPIKNYHLIYTRLADTDHSDIAIFQVDLERMSVDEKKSIPALDISNYPLPSDFTLGYSLVAEGFPYRLGEMDCSQRRWVRGSEKLEARYNGPAELELATSKLLFVNQEQSRDLDGLSGAPVFAFRKISSTNLVVGFAGMIIRANYFINADIIVGALEWVTAHPPQMAA
jgi:hypothetical protein